MRVDCINPARNVLPPSIQEEDFVQAIEMSGYPLQGVVASKLIENFEVTEEWGYIDRDSKDHRSLDVFAFKVLQVQREAEAAVKPRLTLLIECKKTTHPFVFFQDVVTNSTPRFPAISGIPGNQITLHEQNRNRFMEVPLSMALALDKLPFIADGPPICAAFSKAIPSGKRVELSGTDPFNSIVMPLVKAQDHTFELYTLHNKQNTIYPVLILPLCVVDAPMVLVESPQRANDPILAPWVRIVRQEANNDPRSRKRYRFYAIDVVHIDFIDQYISNHLLPFAEEFGSRAIEKGGVLFHGGMVPNLDAWSFADLKQKL